MDLVPSKMKTRALIMLRIKAIDITLTLQHYPNHDCFLECECINLTLEKKSNFLKCLD